MSNQKGFTLIEVVIVCLLLGFLSSLAYGSISGIVRAKQAAEVSGDIGRNARSILFVLNKEIASAVRKSLSNFSNLDQNSLNQRLFLEGQNNFNSSSDQDSIRFVTSTGGKQMTSAFTNHGNVEVSYFLEENKDIKSDHGKVYSLIRSEVPVGVRDAEILKKRAYASTLASNILSLNFRYFNGQQWVEELSGDLPKAIESSLVLIGADGQLYYYKTALKLMNAR